MLVRPTQVKSMGSFAFEHSSNILPRVFPRHPVYKLGVVYMLINLSSNFWIFLPFRVHRCSFSITLMANKASEHMFMCGVNATCWSDVTATWNMLTKQSVVFSLTTVGYLCVLSNASASTFPTYADAAICLRVWFSNWRKTWKTDGAAVKACVILHATYLQWFVLLRFPV